MIFKIIGIIIIAYLIYAFLNRGKVIGVCKTCKPQAERQALMRI